MSASDIPPLRICIVSTGDASRDSRLAPLAESLHRAGNDVCVVSGPTRYPMPESLEIIVVPSRVPIGGSKLAGYLRRILPKRAQDRWFRRRIVAAAKQSRASLFYPLARRDVGAVVRAASTNQAVFQPPGWGAPVTQDIAWLAPHDQRWSRSPAGRASSLHLVRHEGEGFTPEPLRHAGRKVALAYRGATTSPGRYLHAAFERAGVVVDRIEDTVDFGRIDPTVSAVVIVESPYPAFEVTGTKSGVPTLFWVHHGEHHLEANVRLADRYGADAILLAHSWHLSHRFKVPVHRFPFGAAHEISGSGGSFDERSHDVAMVAAGLEHEGGAYSRRQSMAASLTSAFSESSLLAYGLRPEELGTLYRDARVVPNEGGSNHRPITMRVFEAIGNGARLLTEDVPGLDCLLAPERHYVPLTRDPVANVHRVLLDPSSALSARDAFAFVMGHHTYDHRVDELFSVVDSSGSSAQRVPVLDPRELAGMIDADPDAQVIVDYGNNHLSTLLPTRQIRDGDRAQGQFRAQSVDAVVLGPEALDEIPKRIEASRSYVYATDNALEATIAFVAKAHPDAQVNRKGNLARIDLGLSGYRQRRQDHPLA